MWRTVLVGVLHLNLLGSGWAEYVISDDAVSVVVTMSYLSDGIGELVAAVQSLFQRADTATCYFVEE